VDRIRAEFSFVTVPSRRRGLAEAWDLLGEDRMSAGQARNTNLSLYDISQRLLYEGNVDILI
jgi:hypothetical protein